jgi:hypothetical protein
MAKKIPVMTSMELDDEDKLDAVMPIPTNKPDFPWGLRISLTDKELDKLDLDASDVKVGEIFHMHALARVTSISRNSTDGGDECCRLEAQIEDVSIESEDEENEEND